MSEIRDRVPIDSICPRESKTRTEQRNCELNCATTFTGDVNTPSPVRGQYLRPCHDRFQYDKHCKMSVYSVKITRINYNAKHHFHPRDRELSRFRAKKLSFYEEKLTVER